MIFKRRELSDRAKASPRAFYGTGAGAAFSMALFD